MIHSLICYAPPPHHHHYYHPVLHSIHHTIINFQYYSPFSNYTNITEDSRTNGIVSTTGSQSTVRNGQAFILTDGNGNYDGCQQPINPIYYSNGIAIIQRGGNCTFSVKITRAKEYGAAGLLLKLYQKIFNNFSLFFSCYCL